VYPRSQHFDDAVRYGNTEVGGTPLTIIDAYRAGRKVASDLTWEKPSTVTVDEGASAWRTCEVTVTDIDRALLPTTPQAALAPYGTDLYIRTGFRFSDGTTELVPMGVFRVLTTRPTRQGRIQLIGYDYSRVVARARFEVPRVFPKGTSRALAIAALIQERTPGAGPVGHQILSYNLSDDSPLPLTIFEEGERYGDPWKAVTDLADAAGQQVFFYPLGPYPLAVLRPSPDLLNTPPVWTFRAGQGETMIDMKPEQDTTTGYNVYVVTGESSDLAADGLSPVRASAEVTDPESPIFPATYGRVPTFLASSFIKTNAQALAVARANLPLKAGGSEKLSITGFPHPAHEAGDVVRAVDPYLGVNSNWVISRFAIDLALKDPAEYSCRAKRVA